MHIVFVDGAAACREVRELKEELAMMDLMTHLAAGQQQQQQQSQPSQPSQQQPTEGSSAESCNLVNSSRGDSKYAAFSLTQRQQLKQQVLAWLQQPPQQPSTGGQDGGQQLQQQELGDSLAPVPLHNMRQLRELLFAYKVSQFAVQLCAGFCGQSRTPWRASAGGIATDSHDIQVRRVSVLLPTGAAVASPAAAGHHAGCHQGPALQLQQHWVRVHSSHDSSNCRRQRLGRRQRPGFRRR